MKLADRAKIFLPFDALKGFRDALKEQEKIKIKKITLSEDYQEELASVFQTIRKGMMVKVIYYTNKEQTYLSIEGILTNIDEIYKTITIVKTKINIDDIYSISINENEKNIYSL